MKLNTRVLPSLTSIICYETAPLTGVGVKNILQNLQENKQQFSLDVYVCERVGGEVIFHRLHLHSTAAGKVKVTRGAILTETGSHFLGLLPLI